MSEEHAPLDENKPETAGMVNATGDYTGENIEHLSDLEHVRKRPGMYIGDTARNGLHHLVYEVVDNSIDEAMAGYATTISVRVNIDGSCTVEDDGRGIPVDRHNQLSEELGKEVSTLEGVMTVLKFGGKFSKGVYQTSGGLHGVGVTVVNFLSEWAKVEVQRDEKIYQQEYERGQPISEVREIGKAKRTGTKTTFKPDPLVFSVTKFDYETLHRRLQELAFLNRGVKIEFFDERKNQGDTFQYQRGIVEFVEHLNRASDAAHADVVFLETQEEGVEVEIALQYSGEYTENLRSFVNNINTIEGGTHVSGFRSALTRTLNNYGKRNNIFKDLVPTGEDFREGLTAVISVRVPEPQFEGQTKSKLGNSEVERIVNSSFAEFLGNYLEENPRSAKAILNKAVEAAQGREAARKARQLVRDRKGALSGGGLPGKLRDCRSKEMEKCELFLVEGDSAGGSAEGGRNSEYQAILPLRGKIINAYKSRVDKVLSNEEVRSMISAVGVGIGEDVDLSKLRYGKIVVMTDADVDGSHIRTLLLTFFFRQMPQLIQAGHVYVAQPPLFRVKKSEKNQSYIQTEEEMQSWMLERGLRDASLSTEAGTTVTGENMEKLVAVLSELEEAIIALERHGIGLKVLAEHLDKETNRLPLFHAIRGIEEFWFYDPEEVNAFKDQYAPENVDTTGDESEVPAATGPRIQVTELLEVRTINAELKRLTELGFSLEDLIPQERTGTETPRFVLKRGENETGLPHLRSLPAAIRKAGEKGYTITRFKGLGEMNAEELRETTLDPGNRTLLQVRMEEAATAEEMFRILMGEKVEPRREFIEAHAKELSRHQIDV